MVSESPFYRGLHHVSSTDNLNLIAGSSCTVNLEAFHSVFESDWIASWGGLLPPMESVGAHLHWFNIQRWMYAKRAQSAMQVPVNNQWSAKTRPSLSNQATLCYNSFSVPVVSLIDAGDKQTRSSRDSSCVMMTNGSRWNDTLNIAPSPGHSWHAMGTWPRRLCIPTSFGDETKLLPTL